MLGEILVRVGADISDMTRGLREASNELQNFGSNASQMGGQIASTFGAVSVAVAGGLGMAVSTAADFDTAMRKAGAVAGASAEDLEAMRKSALELGATTSQSASSVATAMQEMAAKGYDAKEIIASMPGVISAAEASGEDLALAADTVSSALNIFGLEAKEAGRVADILAETANSTAAGIGDMSYALKYAGAPAAALGISLEETAAAIGLMTNAGIDGSSAGTALRASLLALNNPANEQAKIMDALGVSLYDSEGRMKSISGIIAELTDATKGMTEAEKTATLAKLVGTEAVSGFLALMEAGPSKIDAMTASLENSAGASAKTAEQMKAGIGGAIEEAKGSIETLAIMIGDQLVPYVQKGAEFIAMLANKFNEASPAVQKFITFGAVLTAAITGIIAVGGTLVFLIGNIVSAFGAITGVVSTVVGAVTTVGAFIAKLGGIIAAIANPVGIAITVITSLVAVFVLAYNKCDWFKNMVDKAWKAIKNATVSAFGALKDAVTNAINSIVSFGKTQLKAFSDFWAQSGATIRTAITSALSAVANVFTSTFATIKSIASNAWATIKNATSTAMASVKSLVSSALSSAYSVISSTMANIKSAWSNGWNTIKNTVSNIGKSIVSTLQKINLFSIGKNIIQGLVRGISSLAGTVKAKISEIASGIPSAMKKLLGIHSPSRVLRDEVGQWIPAGVAIGIEQNMGAVTKAAKTMVDASVPNFAQKLSLAERERQAAQSIVANAIKADASELNALRKKASADTAKVEKDANDKILKLKSDAAKKVANLTKNSKTTASQIYAEMNEKIKQIEAQKAESLTKIESKLQADINKIVSSSNADKIKAMKEYVEAQKQAGNMTTKQEAEFWRYSATAFQEGTKEKTEALKQFNQTHAELLKQQFEQEKEYIDQAKGLNMMSLKQELLAYNTYVKGYAKGTEEYNYYTKQMQDTRKSIADNLVKVNEDYVGRMKQINDELIADEQRVTEEYKSALENRFNTIKGYFSLFDEVKEYERVEGADLTRNLSEQVLALSEWQTQLALLKGRGVASGLMEELSALGVDATAQLQALNRMTDAELSQYQELYNKKMEVAKNAAIAQLAPLETETTLKVEAMRNAAVKEIAKLQADWNAEIDNVVNGTGERLNTLKDVGAVAIRGLRDGILGMTGEIASAASTLASTIEKSIRSALAIHSPSRTLKSIGVYAGEGLARGLVNTEAEVERASLMLANAATPTIKPVDFSGYTSDATTQMETKLQTQFKDEEKQKQGDLVLQVDGYELARVQKSHIGGFMQRDTALRTTVRGL